jgi:hypothetical protein
MPLTETDIVEIVRISRKKSVRKIASTIIKDLDQETLGSLISAYLVLKAHGHPDSDLVKYLATNLTGKTLKLGLKAGGSTLPSIITDGELRSLMLQTRAQMNRKKNENLKKATQPTSERKRVVMLPTATQA